MCSRRGSARLTSVEEQAYNDDLDYAAEAEAAAELAYERHLEDRGWEEARAQEDYEARMGCLSFQEAYDQACPERVIERPLRDAEVQAFEEAVIRNGRSSNGLDTNERAQAWMERRVEEILADQGLSVAIIEARVQEFLAARR